MEITNLSKYQESTFFLASSKIVTILAGPIILYFIVLLLSPSQQGFYFAFNSIQNLSILFELGFANIITIQISYAYGFKILKKKFKTELKKKATEFFNKFILLSFFLMISQIICLLIFFDAKDFPEIIGPFALLLIATFIDFYLIFLLATLEGLRRNDFVFKMKFYKSFIIAIFLILFLTLDFGLYSLPISQILAIIVIYFFIFKNFNVFEILNLKLLKFKLSFFKSTQWQQKVNLVTLFGFFSSSFLVLIIFKILGPIEAGKIGLIIALFSFSANLSYSFIQSKISFYSKLVERKKNDMLKKIISQDLIKYYTSGYLFLIASLFFLFYFIKFFPEYSEKFPNNEIIIYIFLGYVMLIFSQPFGHIARLYQKEPLFFISLSYSSSLLISSIFNTKFYGLVGFSIGLLVCNFLFLFFFNTIYFYKFYRSNIS
jgi:O-antigen/teichoic acid export membrane protein